MVISPSFDVPIFRICVYARYNIQYARIGASNSEVEEAASSADMHSRILTFPKGERRSELLKEKRTRVLVTTTVTVAQQTANKMTLLRTNIHGQRRP